MMMDEDDESVVSPALCAVVIEQGKRTVYGTGSSLPEKGREFHSALGVNWALFLLQVGLFSSSRIMMIYYKPRKRGALVFYRQSPSFGELEPICLVLLRLE